MKRSLLVVAAGLVGVVLGVGLSLVADALAGNRLSDPVPIGVVTDARIARSPSVERPKESGSPAHDAGDDHGGSNGGSNSGTGERTREAEGQPTPRASGTDDASPEPTATSSEDQSGSHDDGSGSSSSDDD